MIPTVSIWKASFSDSEEGSIAMAERLVLASAQVAPEALKTLVRLTALACGSQRVVAMTCQTASLDELESCGLVGQDEETGAVLLK